MHVPTVAGGRRRNAAATWPRSLSLEALDGAIPARAIQEVLEKTGRAGRRERCLTGQVTVRLVLAICLWPAVSVRDCLRNLIEGYRQGLRRLEEAVPVKSALSAARARLGVRPLRELCRRVLRPLAGPQTKGAFYHGLRLVTFDGTSLNLPDTPGNERVFGRPGTGRGRAAFPQARLLWLMEAATRAALDFIAVPCRIGEKTAVRRLFRSLRAGMLVLWDRGFHSYALWKALAGTGASVLAHVQVRLVLRPIERFADGSFLAAIYPDARSRRKGRDALLVRVVEYTLNDPARPHHREKHRLLTSLLDPHAFPARELIALYHERWETEIGLDEIKVHQNENRPVLRSLTPRGVFQEIHGLVLVHFALCHLRHEAALAADLDPDRLSFVHTLRVVRRAIPAFQAAPSHDLPALYRQMLAEIGQEILPPRRNRIWPRVVKQKMSNFPLKRDIHRHPPQPTSTFADCVEVLK